MRDLMQRAVDVRHRRRGEIAEPVGAFRDEVRRILVDPAGHVTTPVRLACRDAGGRERQDAGSGPPTGVSISHIRSRELDAKRAGLRAQGQQQVVSAALQPLDHQNASHTMRHVVEQLLDKWLKLFYIH